MRWLRVACLGALLMAVEAQQPAHDEITEPRVTDAPDTSMATDPASNDQSQSENTKADSDNEDSGDNPENSKEDKSDEITTANPDEDTSEKEESGDTSEIIEPNSNEDSGDIVPDPETSKEDKSDEITTAIPDEDTSEKEDSGPTSDENNPDSSGNDSTDSTEPDPDNNMSQSLEGVGAEIAGDPIKTEGGLVQGYYLNGDADLEIRSYYDIPYGTFSYFKPPEKHPGWKEVRVLTQHQTRCPQPNEDEDGEMEGELGCLTLSVFSPEKVENAGVLFHIYDGNFQSGSADPSIYNPQNLVSKGVIVVLPNYRLNVLGFLCTRNSIAPGNAGLKDLNLALEWTKNNIALFGGDPSKIVVSGDGTAGALAGYLAISPMSRDYVSRVIAESGSVLAHWAIDRNPGKAAATFRRNLNRDIDAAPINVLVKSAKDIQFKPCIEVGPDAFIEKAPWELLNEDNINKTFMIGAANHAGLHEAMQHSEDSLSDLNKDFSKLLPNDLEFENDNQKAEIGASVKKQYFADGNVEDIEKLSLCYTDAYYLGPTIRAARPLVAAGSRVYFYEFSFVGDLNRIHDSLQATIQGAARGDIIGYVFVQDEDLAQDSKEAKMVDLITDLWVTFIQTGTPIASNVEWLEMENVKESEETYLLLDEEPKPHKGLREDLALWTKIYKEHFIDRNSAIHFTYSFYFLVLTALLQFHFG